MKFKIHNRLPSLNGVPVATNGKTWWKHGLFVLLFVFCAIGSFLAGHINGLYFGAVQLKRDTGYTPQQLEKAREKVNELLQKAKKHEL